MLKRIFRSRLTSPWMLYEEVEIIEELLRQVRPRQCLEWGAGYSTLYFPKAVSEVGTWHTVEHDKEWCSEVAAMNTSASTHIHHVAPNRLPSDADDDGTYADFKDYVEYPSGLGKFEFILVDGRARKECLSKAHELVADNGVVVLHDAQRPYYHAPFSLYESRIMLEGYSSQDMKLWVGSKGLDLDRLIDVPKLRDLWRTYRRLSKARLFDRHLLFYVNDERSIASK